MGAVCCQMITGYKSQMVLTHNTRQYQTVISGEHATVKSRAMFLQGLSQVQYAHPITKEKS
jgi:hypothetical protein